MIEMKHDEFPWVFFLFCFCVCNFLKHLNSIVALVTDV